MGKVVNTPIKIQGRRASTLVPNWKDNGRFSSLLSRLPLDGSRFPQEQPHLPSPSRCFLGQWCPLLHEHCLPAYRRFTISHGNSCYGSASGKLYLLVLLTSASSPPLAAAACELLKACKKGFTMGGHTLLLCSARLESWLLEVKSVDLSARAMLTNSLSGFVRGT